ncbi:MAG: aspartate 1-decarboxylase [Pseudomonadota bacterium]
MMIEVLKSKIHGARVTKADLEYEGSLGIPYDIIESCGLYVNEKIEVYNVTNGNRFSTYVIKESAGSGNFFVNGAAAHLAKPGDKIIIASYAHIDEKEMRNYKPTVVRLDADNKVIKERT